MVRRRIIPAEAPAAALQRRPLGLILGAAWGSEDMAAEEFEDGELDIGGAIEEKRVLRGEGNGGGAGSHGLIFQIRLGFRRANMKTTSQSNLRHKQNQIGFPLL